MEFKAVEFLCQNCRKKFIAQVDVTVLKGMGIFLRCNHCNLVKHGLSEGE